MSERSEAARGLPAEGQPDMNPAGIEERERLVDFQRRVRQAVQQIDARLHDYAQEVQTRKEYLWDARRDMDHIEKIAVRQTIEQAMRSADVLKEQQNKLLKLMRSPYFGRFDFARSGVDLASVIASSLRDDGFRGTACPGVSSPLQFPVSPHAERLSTSETRCSNRYARIGLSMPAATCAPVSSSPWHSSWHRTKPCCPPI